jgi:hypothetical protein
MAARPSGYAMPYPAPALISAIGRAVARLLLLAGGAQRLTAGPLLEAVLEVLQRCRCSASCLPHDPYDLPNAPTTTASCGRPVGEGRALAVSAAALTDHVCDSRHRWAASKAITFPGSGSALGLGAQRGPNLHAFRHRRVCKARVCASLPGACTTSTGRDAREVVHASREGRRLSAALRYGRVTAPRASAGSTRRRQLRGPPGEVAGGDPEGGAEPARASRRLRRVSQRGRWGCVVARQAPRPEHKDG